MSKAPSRSRLIAGMQRAFDGFIRIFGDTTVPLSVRLHSWREGNAIMDALFEGEPTNGRARRR